MMKTHLIGLFLFFLFMSPLAHAQSTGDDNAFILPQYAKRISLDFKNADIRDVLKVFSQQIGSNFIITDKVPAKQITVFLEKVPVEDALAKILIANGLVYRYDQGSNIFMVEPKDETEKIITRVYPLRYATVPSSKVLSTFAVSDEESGGASTAATSIVDAITSFLSKSGKIATDTRTNSLIITDAELKFPDIERTIARLDVPVPQVLIQVEMIDTSKNVLDEMGVKFSNTIYKATGLGQAESYTFPFKKNLTNGFLEGSLSSSEFTAILQFLTTRTDTRSLARPRILTMDNQTAQIKISADEVVGVKVTQPTTQGGTVTETAERMETGVILTVTPQVNLLSGDIMMAVSPRVIDVKESSVGSAFKDPETRGVKLMMRARDSETIVIGGLLRTSKDTKVIKIPILGDIPLLGRAFRHKKQDADERELLIFITPHILSPDGASLSGKDLAVNINDRESSLSGRTQTITSELDRASTRRRSR